jgi:WD40 repeat protein
MGLLRLFDGKADIVDLVLRHFHGASGWDNPRCDARIFCVQYGPAGDVIATGDADGFIHLICAQTGEKILSLKGHR